jgi:LuxR family maltose regulon positive regulatory protein
MTTTSLPSVPAALLTPRQTEILTLLAQGLYYKEVAAALGISQSTVRAHAHMTYQRLQVRSRSQAILKLRELSGKTAA